MKKNSSRFKFFLLISLLTLLVILSGFLFYSFEVETLGKDKKDELASIAQLKIYEVSSWFTDQLIDASIISKNYLLVKNLEQLLKNPDTTLTREMNLFLSSFIHEHSLDTILVTDTTGKFLLVAQNQLKSANPILLETIKNAVKSKSAVSTDLYSNDNYNKIYIDFVSPIANSDGITIAVLVCRVDPSFYLFPFIQTWPGKSKSAETMILKKEGDSIVFLNELRHKKATALQLKYSLKHEEMPSVKAVSGYTGLVYGTDYMGKRVVSYVSSIPETPWFIVSKINRHELFDELYQRAGLIIALTLLVLLLVYTVLAYFFSERQQKNYKSLLETQEEYRTTLYSIGDGVITTDDQCIIQHMNPVAEQLTGWKEKQAKGKNLSEVFNIINEETHEVPDCPVKKVLDEGKVVGLSNHTILLSKNGKAIPIADSSAPIRNNSGKIIGVVLVFHDQTSEREARNRVLHEMKKSQQYLDVAGVIMVALDTSGNISMINKKGCELLGYSDDQLRGKSWFETAIPVNKRSSVSSIFKQFISGDINPVEFYKNEIITSSGEQRIVAWHNALLFDEFGNISGTLSSGEDITQHQMTEEALAKEKYLFESLFDSIPDSIYFKDLDSRFIEINKNMIRTLGISDPKEAIGKTDHDFFDIEHADDALKDEQQIIRTGIPIIGKEEKESWQDGNVNWVSTTKLPLRDANGNIIGIMGLSRNINESKQVEAALRESEERYKMVSELTSDYIYKVDVDEKNTLSISFVSESFYTMTGRELNEAREMSSWEKIIYADDYPAFVNLIQQLLITRQNGEIECRSYVKDGQLRWVYILARPILNDDHSRIVSIIGSVKDITDRKIAEDALRASEEKHRILLDESTDPIFSFSADGTYLYVNSAFAEGVERSVDQILGKKIWDVFPKEEANQRFAALKSVFETGEGKVIEVRVPRSDNDRYYITTITPIKNQKGEVISVICSSKDITDRKRAEIILKESEEKFRIAFDNAPSGMSIIKADGKYIAVNPMLCRMFGYSEEELLAGKLQDITHPDDIERGNEWIKKMISGDLSEPEFEKRYIHKDGHIVWGLVRAQWIKNPDGTPRLSIAHILDITERIKSQEAIKESEEIFRNFMEYSPVYVFFKDENIRSLKLSKNYEQMLGKPINELLGKTMDDLFPSDMARSMIEDDKNILREGKLVVVDEELNGRFYTTIKYPIQIDKKTRYLAGFTIDITEKKKAEEILRRQKEEIEKQNQEYAALNEEYLSLNEELRTSNEELAAARDKALESDRLKSAFLANMSHEIRTPMNAIIGFSDLLYNRDLEPEKLQQFTYTIRQRAYDLLTLINDILDISKIEAGQMTLSRESGDLDEILADVYTTFKTIWCDSGKSKVTFLYKNHLTDLENRIITDTGRLRQILSNLINNAFKFTLQGRVYVSCHKTDDGILQFCVEDTGIGITSDKLTIIFDRFRQADDLYSQNSGGTGLGLSISKGLVELLGGKIWVESEHGKGSSFFFSIPYNPDPDNMVVPREKNIGTHQWSKRKLLLVEDDEFNTDYLMEALKKTGINIVSVVLGKEAIEKIRSDADFDLVLLDIRLPDIEGYEVASKIKKYRPQLPIIAQTAYASDIYRKRCKEAGCVDYLAKPIRQAELLEVLSRFLEGNN
jgi:PAS domain S-box-containing protein